MKKQICAAASVAALVLVGTTWAATASPTLGNWTGKYKGVKPATSLSFTVAVAAHTGKRVVTFWQSGGSFKAPCANAHGTTTSVALSSTATVNAAGKFKGVASEDNGFGLESWTVTGTFKSKHAASGTVAINLAITAVKRCKFTVPWTASLEPASHPVDGTTYKGKASVSAKPLSFHVSASGKALTTVSWQAPLIGGTCPGLGSESPTYTAHNVAIHNAAFSVTLVSGKGTPDTGFETIAGRFLSGRKAAGSVSTHAIIKSFGDVCQGTETWTAHAT